MMHGQLKGSIKKQANLFHYGTYTKLLISLLNFGFSAIAVECAEQATTMETAISIFHRFLKLHVYDFCQASIVEHVRTSHRVDFTTKGEHQRRVLMDDKETFDTKF